ncbi:MAG: cupin domain-containing protein [Candidatus Sedimenticola sp. 20ELBAFRAG]
MQPNNLLSSIPEPASGEVFTLLLQCRNVTIERIVSAPGTVSDLFVQEQDEWILLLQGSAELRMADRTVKLKQGDSFFIPAQTPHQVTETSAQPLCVWMAVHIHPETPPLAD